MRKEYLNEEKFQKINRKVNKTGKIVANIMLIIGIGLIFTGIYLLNNSKKENENNKNIIDGQKNSIEEKISLKEKEIKEEKNNLKNKLNQIKSELENKKQKLISSGIRESYDYNDGESYDLYILDNALNPGLASHHCAFDQYKKNELTANYCTLINLLDDDFPKYNCEDSEMLNKYCTLKSELVDLRNEKINYTPLRNESRRIIHIPFIIIGVFISFASFIVRFMFFSITHRREIMAYSAQQIMPIAEEGIEKMAPSAGMIAKEISKGIKEGLDEKK